MWILQLRFDSHLLCIFVKINYDVLSRLIIENRGNFVATEDLKI